MSARDELGKLLFTLPVSDRAADTAPEIMRACDEAADAILDAGYRKPRTITTAAELEALPFGSAVQTSDESDTVVLKGEGVLFRNQSGADLSATDLWRFGTRPFTVIFEPSGE